MKELLHAKRKHQQNKKEPTIWENISVNYTSGKGLISNIHIQNLYYSTSGVQTIQLKNGKRT